MTTVDEILESYLRICHEEGPESVTLKRIAEKAKVAFGTAHYHFGKSPGLLKAKAAEYVSLRARNFIVDWMLLHRPTKQRPTLLQYYEAHFEWAKKFPHHAGYWLYHYSLASLKTKTPDVYKKTLALAYSRIETFLFEDMGRGIIPKIREMPLLVEGLHSNLVGSLVLWCSNSYADRKYSKVLENSQKLAMALLKAHS